MSFLLKLKNIQNINDIFMKNQRYINLLTRFRIVDNSEIGKFEADTKPPFMIGRNPNNGRYKIGDVIAISFKHKVMKAMIVALKEHNRRTCPKYSDNCIILLDENKTPIGTRVTIPLPAVIKKRLPTHHKIHSMCKTFL